MKIRVILIFLMCTSIAADNRNAMEDQRISSNINFTEKKDFSDTSLPRHRIYEYSRSMDANNVDLKNQNSGSQARTTKPKHQHQTQSVDAKYHAESERTMQHVSTMRMNPNQRSEILDVGFVPQEEKVLPRKKKDHMEQAMLALLIAYKMKFTALIPILLGGLSLLASTTALAGFFFALFAAVLGLKGH